MSGLGEFLASFVRPLVAGGEVHVGRPIPPAAVAAWAGALPGLLEVEAIAPGGGEAQDGADPGTSARAVAAAMREVVAGLVVRPPVDGALGAPELHLAAALHDALVLIHPALGSWPGRRARSRVEEAAGALLAAVPPPTGRDDLLRRHALLHALPELRRVDVRLRWWTGSRTFRGQRPPARLLRWRGLRRVRESELTVSAEELLAVADMPLTPIAALFSTSPLTDLVHAGRALPAFAWSDAHLGVLRDAELARAVAYAWLGGTGAGLGGGAPAAAAAALLRVAGRPTLARAAGAFLVHVSALHAVAVSATAGDGPPDASPDASPLLAEALARASGRMEDGTAVLLALPEAAGAVDPAFAPPGLDGESAAARRFRAHRAQVRAALGEAFVGALAGRLAAAFGPAAGPV